MTNIAQEDSLSSGHNRGASKQKCQKAWEDKPIL